MRLVKFGYLILLIILIIFYSLVKIWFVTIILLFILESYTTKRILSLINRVFNGKLLWIVEKGNIIILILALSVFVRTFFFDFYFVSSISMEKTLITNDYVFINKFLYGAKLPKNRSDIPIIGSLYKYEDNIQNNDSYIKLNHFKKFKREDIVVFKSLINNKKYLIKRIIGLPGESFKLLNSKTYINGELIKDKPTYCYDYFNENNKTFKIYSNSEFDKLDKRETVNLKKSLFVEKSVNYDAFPNDDSKKWCRDNYGAILIPKKGMKIALNKDNLNIYKKIILNYEGVNISIFNNDSINYTFKNNYYFLLGDNRHHTEDSRNFGFVPESFIQGKVIWVF